MENQASQDQNQSPKIKLYTVHSTNVKAIGWYYCTTSKKGVMIVEFIKGAKYMYFEVLQEKFQEALKSTSIGKWVQDNLIRNKEVTSQKLGQPILDL